MESIMTLDEVASYLRVSRMFMYNSVRRRTIPFFKIGSRIRFRKDSIERWIHEKENFKPSKL
jgi:excisionase family DNA binding protein